MTDLVDLITNPQERMTVLFDAFIKKLETSHQEAEQKLDRVLEHFRLKLHRQHLKTVYSYKKILDELWIRVQKDKDLPVLAMFEQLLRSEQPELYADVFDRAIPVIKEIEREGGTLDCRIQKAGYGPGGCLYSDRADGHFSFCSEFLDGFEDDVEFKITRMRKDEKKAKELEEARDREWREKWLAKQTPKNEVMLADCAKLEGSEPMV
jgi:RNAse (barnase) inhibitor barstar